MICPAVFSPASPVLGGALLTILRKPVVSLSGSIWKDFYGAVVATYRTLLMLPACIDLHLFMKYIYDDCRNNTAPDDVSVGFRVSK